MAEPEFSEPSIDTGNRQVVAVQAGTIRVLNPPSGPMSPAQAMSFAAWLVACAEVVVVDPAGFRFEQILAAVRNT